jgi:GNAT superfamily N-acetyltransferase
MVSLLVTYMEMTAPPALPAVEPPLDAVVQCERMAAVDYLDLYRRVGAPVQWDSRLKMAVADLDRWLSAEDNRVNVLRLGGLAVGLCEFEGIGRAEVELVHFGLAPAVQGRGLGTYLLDRSLRDCWRFGPDRIWLHTDTNDHPNAAFVYAKAGCVPYRQRVETFAD